VTDGRSFLETASDSWDIIVVDAYEGDDLGAGLSGRGFFRVLRERLHAGGAFAFNVVGSLGGSGPVRSVVRAAAYEFHDVRVLPVMTATEEYDPLAERNVVIIGTNSSA
jgi:spermidine synthase